MKPLLAALLARSVSRPLPITPRRAAGRARMIGNARCLRAGGTLYSSEVSIRKEENAVLPIKFLD
jgi:hypothetical protein